MRNNTHFSYSQSNYYSLKTIREILKIHSKKSSRIHNLAKSTKYRSLANTILKSMDIFCYHF